MDGLGIKQESDDNLNSDSIFKRNYNTCTRNSGNNNVILTTNEYNGKLKSEIIFENHSEQEDRLSTAEISNQSNVTKFENEPYNKVVKVEGYCITCVICKIQFNDLKAYRAHKNLHFKIKCKFCTEIFHSNEALKSHTEEVHPEIINTEDSDSSGSSICKEETGHNLRDLQMESGTENSQKNRKRSKSYESKERPKCEVCGKTFARKRIKEAHMASHYRDEGYKCGYCMRLFLSDEDLVNHFLSAHHETVKMSDFKMCNVCRCMFTDEKLCKNHIDENPHSCTDCNRHFSTEKLYEIHLSRHSRKKYECQFCDKHYLLSDSLRRHLKSHHFAGQNILPLQIREQLSQKSKDGCSNEESDTGNKLIKCSSKSADDESCDVEEDDRNVADLLCDVCNATFVTWEQLESHKISSSPYGCKMCMKHFSRLMTMKEHMNTHSKEVVFQCEYCTKTYHMMGSLRSHIRYQHSQCVEMENNHIKMYLCDSPSCSEKFPQYKDFVSHVRHEHKGTKPYKCNRCDRQFSVSAHLDIHKKRRHENIKPYKCDVCQKPFFRKKFMMKHYSKHIARK